MNVSSHRGRPVDVADMVEGKIPLPAEGCWGGPLDLTVVGDDASVSSRRCLAVPLQQAHADMGMEAWRFLQVNGWQSHRQQVNDQGVDCRCTTCGLLPEQPAGHSQFGWRRSHLNLRILNEAITCWALWDFLQVNG